MTTGYSAVPSNGPAHSIAGSHAHPEAHGQGETSHDQEGTEADLDGDDDDDDEGSYAGHEAQHNMKQETTVKSGYLEKKGEKRKAWKKRWFVLRSSKLSYYKNDKEYQLLRFIDIGDIKTVAAVEMKKSLHTFGIVTPKRTFYVRASSKPEMDAWIEALNDLKTQYAQSSTMTQDMATMQLSTADVALAQQSRSNSNERSAAAIGTGSDNRDGRAITIGIPGQGTFVSPAQPRPIPGSSAFSPLSITSESEAGTTDRYGLSYNSSAAGHSLSGSPARIDTSVPFVAAGQSPSGQHSGSDLSDYGMGHQRRPSAGFGSVPRQRSTSGTRRFGSGSGYDPPASPSIAPGGNQILSSSDEEDEWDEEEFADQVMPLPAMGAPLQQVQQQNPQAQQQLPQSLSVTTPGLNTGSDLIRDPNKVITQGYLMKQSGRRKVWRKRWFVLTSSRLHYARSHMDGKAHRQIPISSILDAIEYEAKKAAPIPASGPTSPSIGSPLSNPFSPEGAADRQREIAASTAGSSNAGGTGAGPSGPPEKPERRGSMVAAAAGVASNMSAGMGVGGGSKKKKENCFQIITPKRTYILCAPSEDEEIKWISAVKTLINRQRNAQTPGLTTPMSPTSGMAASSFPFHFTQPPPQGSGAANATASTPGSAMPSATAASTAQLPSITAAAQTLSPPSRQNSSSGQTQPPTQPGPPAPRQRTPSSTSQHSAVPQATSS